MRADEAEREALRVGLAAMVSVTGQVTLLDRYLQKGSLSDGRDYRPGVLST
ncbi:MULTISPECIES: hypothetical protein [Nitrosospira]|uniref:hypothetical protein n=1 Tax=Nitrosospira TaxID=35798 RepID=UPI0015A3CEED|nr:MULTISPECIES: hypothetical protein [Nitrosospira]